MTEREREQQQYRRTVLASLATRSLILVAAALATTIVCLQLITAVQANSIARGIARDQVAAAVRGRDIARTADQIESCTTPGKRCFKRGQDATAEAVASINEVVIIAAACADRPRRQGVEEIQACVISELAKHSKHENQ